MRLSTTIRPQLPLSAPALLFPVLASASSALFLPVAPAVLLLPLVVGRVPEVVPGAGARPVKGPLKTCWPAHEKAILFLVSILAEVH